MHKLAVCYCILHYPSLLPPPLCFMHTIIYAKFMFKHRREESLGTRLSNHRVGEKCNENYHSYSCRVFNDPSKNSALMKLHLDIASYGTAAAGLLL